MRIRFCRELFSVDSKLERDQMRNFVYYTASPALNRHQSDAELGKLMPPVSGAHLGALPLWIGTRDFEKARHAIGRVGLF